MTYPATFEQAIHTNAVNFADSLRDAKAYCLSCGVEPESLTFSETEDGYDIYQVTVLVESPEELESIKDALRLDEED